MLSQAELNSTIRENLTHLIKRIDDVANAANASARILIYMNHADFLKLHEDVLIKILEMAKLSVEAIKLLNLMVKGLMAAKNVEMQKLGEEVNTLEHKCDEIHFAINRILVSNNPDINPFSAIEIHDCIYELENISDNAEDVADYIIMLTVSKRT